MYKNHTSIESPLLRTCKNYSKIFYNNWFIFLLLFAFAGGCKKNAEGGGIITPCPVVTSTDPTDKAVDVLLNKVISVTFNTAMNPSTINRATFTIQQGTLQISGNIAPTANAAQFTFTPDISLLPFTTYKGTITAGAADKFRTTMIADYVFTFTTIPKLTISSTPAAVGTTTGAGLFAQGSKVTVNAVPNTGYSFTNWTDSGSATVASTSPSYQFTMAGNRTLVANFAVQSSTAVPLGTAANFGAMGGTAGITNQGINTVINNGSIATTGVSTTVTGFHDNTGDKYIETPLNIGKVTGRIYTDAPPPVIFGPGGPFGGNAITKAIADQALLDATVAYQSISPASKPGGIDPGAGELGGLSLAPGIYKAANGTFKITLLDLELDAKGDPNAVWIFQTASSLTVGNPSAPRSITFKSGVGSPKNVLWYVGSTAVINYAGGGTMVGTIIANSGVTLSSPANSTNNVVQTVLNGRALSLVSSVTMVNTVINNQ